MNIFREICAALREDKRAMLATILSADGSTPAPAQSRMLVRLGGKPRCIGTIGGGCLDLNVQACMDAEPQRQRARIMTFELTDDVGDTGLACGGRVSVLLEPLTESSLPIWERIAALQEAGDDCVLATLMAGDGTTEKILLDGGGQILAPLPRHDDKGGSGAVEQAVLSEIRNSIRRIGLQEEPMRFESGGREFVVELIEAAPSLIIFGAGRVGKVTAQVAALAGFRVTVVDDRAEFANAARFAGARVVVCESFETAFRDLEVTDESYVVIVTRGHKHDELVLGKVLRFSPKYVGMIGSQRKVRLTFENLERQGVPREKLAGVQAPIGVAIGARNADEIAVSIVAQLIAVRRRQNSAPTFRGGQFQTNPK